MRSDRVIDVEVDCLLSVYVLSLRRSVAAVGNFDQGRKSKDIIMSVWEVHNSLLQLKQENLVTKK